MLKFLNEAANPLEALPLGNGRLGALVFGGAQNERIVLNEDTLWSGYPRDRRNPEAFAHLQEARQLIFAGKNHEAQQIIEKYMLGELSESYMPMGDLLLKTLNAGPVSEYTRTLSLSESLVRVAYRQDGAAFERLAYVSAPDDVLAIEWTSDTPGTLSFELSLESQLHHTVTAGANAIALTGRCPDHVEPNYRGNVPHPVVYDQNRGLQFCVEALVYADGGELAALPGKLRVSGATRCTILCTSHNSFRPGDTAARCSQTLSAAAARLSQLRRRHTEDFASLYNRVTLRLGSGGGVYEMERLVSDARSGNPDPVLYEMLFAYGRYLSICSSRQGLPANLQGIWNWDLRPAWSGNWTTNINLPMNYWPVESCALPECGEQLVLWLETVIPAGRDVAANYYRADGWCMHHNVDMWGKMTPTQEDARYGFWPLAGVWLCQQVYRHYLYSNDREFLRDHALPIMEGAVRFCLDWLIEGPDGEFVTCPSTSPENTFFVGDTQEETAVCISSASDIAMIAELLDNFTEGCGILGIDSPLLPQVREKRRRMKWFSIGEDGALLEWDRPYREADAGHRHFSHLYGCYPGDLYMKDASLLAASEKAFERRLASGGGRLGWSRVWALALAARFQKREISSRLLRKFVLASIAPNGFDFYVASEELPATRSRTDSALSDGVAGWFQIDGNFGFTAAVVELLLQAYHGRLILLPCLPPDWPQGYVRGLRAPGDLTVDMEWADGELVSARLATGSRFDECTPLTVCTGSYERHILLKKQRDYLLVPMAGVLELMPARRRETAAVV